MSAVHDPTRADLIDPTCAYIRLKAGTKGGEGNIEDRGWGEKDADTYTRLPLADVRRHVKRGGNLAILTGVRSGRFVVDVDPQHDGDKTMAALEAEHGSLPETVKVRTPHGGYHFHFRLPSDFTVGNDSAGKAIGRGVDIKGEYGYVVAPGSATSDGSYVLETDPSQRPADAPDWLLHRLRAHFGEKATQRAAKAASGAVEVPPKVECPDACCEALARRALEQIAKRMDRLARLPERETLKIAGEERGWDMGFYLLGARLAQIARWPHTTVTLEEAEKVFFEHAPEADGTFDPVHKWEDAVQRAADDGSWFKGTSHRNTEHVYVISRAEVGLPPLARSGQDADDGEVRPEGKRHLVAVPLDTVAPASALWLWVDLMPVGELTLLAGRQGIGKSTLAYQIAADVTLGKLPGEFFGLPRTVLVVATEDSTAHTIVPRLMAAGADLSRVKQIMVERADGAEGVLDLSGDLPALAELLEEHVPALLIVDPLVSRLGNKDTHKDAEVRQALEPLVSLAHKYGCAVLGLIHLNKSGARDPLALVMGSVAFTAISRSVLFTAADPEDEGNVLLSHEKSNLGAQRKGSMTYRIESATLDQRDSQGRFVETSRLVWGKDDARKARDIIAAEHRNDREKPVKVQAGEWIVGYLMGKPNREASRTDLLAEADGLWSTDQINKGARWLDEQNLLERKRASEQNGPATWQLRRVPSWMVPDEEGANGLDGEAY